MNDVMAAVGRWFASNAGKLIWLAIVVAAAVIATRILSRLMRHALDKTDIPSASIFINLMRVLIWVLAAAMVLQPVFGINPTTIVTALGVGGVALSLGLKDTIANIIGGFGLMFGKVIQPGDLVSISGTTGTVKDITWRQTVIAERGGNEMVIPNSVLNTAQLERLTVSNESVARVPFTAKADADIAEVERDILARLQGVVDDCTSPDNPPLVKFSGFSPYGISGEALLFADADTPPSTVADRATRALAGADWMATAF
ncbi:mechanosensitive ion channel family protein [Bifidobacterium eulemuris]|uniref:Transporter n=2 Tax=Bifidobacterium eulemuris TaxID=1765219 RepID=A0A261G4P7_9BIFI|nr:mechanosensitive ion channel domain-containing protein [Bifidobacterium eulemuris]OZG65976.1 transporter [Bifidobacterium eulemuris]